MPLMGAPHAVPPTTLPRIIEQFQSDRQHERKGDAYLELKQYQCAVDEYKQMKGSAFHMGDALMALKQYKEAGEAYSKSSLHLEAGEAFFQAGMLSESAAAYDQEWQSGIATSPLKTYESLHHARHADALFQTGNVADAAKEFHQFATAYQQGPNKTKARTDAMTSEQIQSDLQHEHKGDAYLGLNQYQRAVGEYKQMERNALHMGDALMALKQYKEAGEAYSKASLRSTANPFPGRELLWKAGEAFFQAGMMSESAAAYDQEWQSGMGQLNLYDSYHHNRARHADALFQTGRVSDAAKEFHKVAMAYQPDPTSLKAKVSKIHKALFPNPYVGCETAEDFAAIDQAQAIRSIDSKLSDIDFQLMMRNPRY